MTDSLSHGDLVANRLAFLPDALLATAEMMFTSPVRASAWIGVFGCDTIEVSAKHRPTPSDLNELKRAYHELFPAHDLASGKPTNDRFAIWYPVVSVAEFHYG